FGFFLTAGLLLWLALKMPSYLFLMGTIGLFSALGLVLHRSLSRKKKTLAHTISLLSIGLGLFFGAGLFGKQNLQLEGMFFNVFLGIMGAGLVHYLVAKIVGPLFVGRLWCGWGCWTFAVMNLLPYKKTKGEAGRAPYSTLRSFFFLLSLGLVALLVLRLGYNPGEDWKTTHAHVWFLAGSSLYLVLGAVLAFVYKDNRAFCKILCPITTILKVTGRFSLLKIGGTPVACNECGACVQRCQMNIDIPAYIAHGRRVLSSECVLCRQCVETCPYGSVDLTLGFDAGRKDLFEGRPDH
ncbi:MAG: 4Fe-4S binding protein, partial [Candidatus Aminicenantes bacterium RBG_16_66_30]